MSGNHYGRLIEVRVKSTEWPRGRVFRFASSSGALDSATLLRMDSKLLDLVGEYVIVSIRMACFQDVIELD